MYDPVRRAGAASLQRVTSVFLGKMPETFLWSSRTPVLGVPGQGGCSSRDRLPCWRQMGSLRAGASPTHSRSQVGDGHRLPVSLAPWPILQRFTLLLSSSLPVPKGCLSPSLSSRGASFEVTKHEVLAGIEVWEHGPLPSLPALLLARREHSRHVRARVMGPRWATQVPRRQLSLPQVLHVCSSGLSRTETCS